MFSLNNFYNLSAYEDIANVIRALLFIPYTVKIRSILNLRLEHKSSIPSAIDQVCDMMGHLQHLMRNKFFIVFGKTSSVVHILLTMQYTQHDSTFKNMSSTSKHIAEIQ